ncbi:hypothetical protein [Delftia tsuruhatensis]|uniref:hypothetical protein n=1 Tax=Delftia tsuruhatensis TaxID=180282 RepID=UPI00202919B7|nr:hypothetical protein [Delftia tsuruhatensis]
MSEEINDRPGAWLSEGNWVYTLQHAGWRRGEEQFENRLVAQVHPGRSSSLSEATQIASIFAEAGTVHHETGLTPRQLVDRMKALESAMRDACEMIEADHVDAAYQMLGEAIANLVKGAKP